MLTSDIRSRATFGIVFVVFGVLVSSQGVLAQLDNNQSLTIARAVEIALSEFAHSQESQSLPDFPAENHTDNSVSAEVDPVTIGELTDNMQLKDPEEG